MLDSTVLKLCSKLSRSELASLRKVVVSPYFNTREEVARLFEYLVDHLGGSPSKLSRETVARHVFKDKSKLAEGDLNRIASLLTDVIRTWLAIEEMRSDGNQSQVYLQLAFKRRGMTEFREKALPQAIAENNRQPLRDLQYHYRQCVLNWDRFDHAARVKWENRAEFKAMTEQQAYYLLTKIIKLGCLGASFESRLGERYDMLFLEEAVRYVEEQGLMHIPAISTFYHVYKCLKNEDAQMHAQQIRKMLAENSGQFSNSDLMFITLSLSYSLLHQHAETEDISFLKESFELYQTALLGGVLTPNGVMSKYTFFNLVSQAVALREFEWTNQFIQEHKKFLPDADRENAYQFHLAQLHFYQKNFDSAAKLLQKVIVRDEVLYNMEARGMQVSILYETGAHDSASYHLESFKTFLRRHPEAGSQREPHTNFIKMTQKLLKTNLKDAAAVEQLRTEIRQMKNLREKTWLLEMLP